MKIAGCATIIETCCPCRLAWPLVCVLCACAVPACSATGWQGETAVAGNYTTHPASALNPVISVRSIHSCLPIPPSCSWRRGRLHSFPDDRPHHQTANEPTGSFGNTRVLPVAPPDPRVNHCPTHARALTAPRPRPYAHAGTAADASKQSGRSIARACRRGSPRARLYRGTGWWYDHLPYPPATPTSADCGCCCGCGCHGDPGACCCSCLGPRPCSSPPPRCCPAGQPAE